MGQKIRNSVFAMARKEAEDYEKSQVLQQEVESSLLSKGIDAVFAIANAIDHLASATEKQANQTVIVLNIDASSDTSNVSHIKKMIEEIQKK